MKKGNGILSYAFGGTDNPYIISAYTDCLSWLTAQRFVLTCQYGYSLQAGKIEKHLLNTRLVYSLSLNIYICINIQEVHTFVHCRFFICACKKVGQFAFHVKV